jgi:TolB-like protein/DNA-binding winged helix-turn-helix (wHTH) protein/Tfp pilus assembly protein PilF
VEAPTTPRLVRFGLFELDLRTGELRKAGIRLGLQEQPLQVLTILLEQAGDLVTREELRQRLWPGDTFVDFEQGLNAAVKRLRQVLGDSAETPRFIETLPRRGYRFIGGVEGRDGESPSPSPRRRRQLVVGFAVLAVLLALAAGAWRSGLLKRATAGGIESLAVLPLENLSGDAEQEYFVDGVHEALITDLAKLSGLKRVIARGSVTRYKRTDRPLRDIARELGVDALVTGAAAQAGDRVRVTVQLVRGSTEELLWAERYERPYRDVLTLQSEVVRAIAHEIEIKLSRQDRVRLASVRPIYPEAYAAYLKGRYHMSRHLHADYQKAVESLEEAIARDPGYAPAYAILAHAYGLLGGFGEFVPREWLPRARTAALRAVELDDGLAEAHVAMAWVAAYSDWDWGTADREFKKAVDLNPGSADAHHLRAAFLARMGRRGEARAEIEATERLDPLSVVVSDRVAWVAAMARDYDRAIAQYRKTLEVNPNYTLALREVSWVYAISGRDAEAVAAADRAFRLSPDVPTLGRLGIAYGMAGRRDRAGQVLAVLMERRKSQYVPPIDIAMVHIGLGQKDQAFEWLNKAYDDRVGRIVGLKELPLFDPLRGDPRFDDLLRRMNFPP